MTVRQRIVNKSIELLHARPQGLRFSELAHLLREELPDIKPNNIPATLVNLEALAEGYLRADQRACLAALENLHRKYAVTAKEIEARRDAAAARLKGFLVEVGYE